MLFNSAACDVITQSAFTVIEGSYDGVKNLIYFCEPDYIYVTV